MTAVFFRHFCLLLLDLCFKNNKTLYVRFALSMNAIAWIAWIHGYLYHLIHLQVPREARWSYGAAVGASSVSMSTSRCLLRFSTSSSWVALQQLPCRSWGLPRGATCCGSLSCWTSKSRGDIGSYATIGHQERNISSWKLSVFFFAKDVSERVCP